MRFRNTRDDDESYYEIIEHTQLYDHECNYYTYYSIYYGRGINKQKIKTTKRWMEMMMMMDKRIVIVGCIMRVVFCSARRNIRHSSNNETWWHIDARNIHTELINNRKCYTKYTKHLTTYYTYYSVQYTYNYTYSIIHYFITIGSSCYWRCETVGH